MSTSDGLPPGWTAVYNEDYGCNYFHHQVSGKTQWEPPEGSDAAIYPAVLADQEKPDASIDEHATAADVENAPLTTLEEDCSPGLISSTKIITEPLPQQRNDSRDTAETPAGTVQASPSDEAGGVGAEANDSNNSGGESISKANWIGGSSQDYMHLAEMYRCQRVYADLSQIMDCVLCRKRPCSDVFFPCQHRCLCPECIVTNQVVEHHHMALVPHGHCNCPLCGAVIKKIIPSSGGGEIEAYWNWVCEVNPHLPDGFLRNFRHSAAVIQKVYVVDNNKNNKPSKSCVIS